MKRFRFIFLLLYISILLILTSQSQTVKRTSLNDLALTPPMGWNGWNHFRCDEAVNEQLIKEMADAMVESGMKDVGYEYINLDDCWQIGRRNDETIIVDPERFPSGMQALVDYVHSKGLKFGIYTSAGRQTCEGRPGSYGYEQKDADTYAHWGVDYVKVDWCGIEYLDTVTQYSKWRQAIKSTGRPMVLSIAIADITNPNIGDNRPWIWGKGIGHLWRTTLDIRDRWEDIVRIIDRNSQYAEYARVGGWNDPDMLEVGNGGMTEVEYRSHFSMWAMMAAPLVVGNDLRNMSTTTKEILTNSEVIAVNQDPLGIQGTKVSENGGLEVWSKKLQGYGNRAVVLLNRESRPANITVKWSDTNLADAALVRDLWARENLGLSVSSYTAEVPSHGVVMLKVYGIDSGLMYPNQKLQCKDRISCSSRQHKASSR